MVLRALLIEAQASAYAEVPVVLVIAVGRLALKLAKLRVELLVRIQRLEQLAFALSFFPVKVLRFRVALVWDCFALTR
jgi:hypothetical protein